MLYIRFINQEADNNHDECWDYHAEYEFEETGLSFLLNGPLDHLHSDESHIRFHCLRLVKEKVVDADAAIVDSKHLACYAGKIKSRGSSINRRTCFINRLKGGKRDISNKSLL